MKNIVVIGGGFAGTTLAQRLEWRLPADWQLTLISDENFMVYTPLLPEVVGASLLPGHAVAPVRRMVRHAQYYRARVEEIDLGRRMIHYRDRDTHSQSFDHLVFACGKTADLDFAEGMQARALPLKTLGDALHIRNRIIVRLEQAELEDDPEVRRTLTTFIVVGGGSSGVEAAGAIADFLRVARRYYRRTEPLDTRVILLEAGDRLVPEFPASLAAAALRSMTDNEVEIHLEAPVRKVTPLGVKTESGEWIRGANVICTIGTVANPLVRTLDLPEEQGLIRTQPDMSVPGLDGIWAIGDCAAVINARDGTLSPPTAQFAVRQGRQLADNLVRAIAGKETRPFSYRARGQVATIGHRRAIAEVFGVKLAGFPAWLLWRALYLSMLPTFLRKLQVFSEWNLELLFPRDITQLNLARTAQSGETQERGDEAREPLRKVVHG
jgi:NADH dehydrogenase